MLVDKQNELMSDLLFTSTSMAAMTLRENHLFNKTEPTESTSSNQVMNLSPNLGTAWVSALNWLASTIV